MWMCILKHLHLFKAYLTQYHKHSSNLITCIEFCEAFEDFSGSYYIHVIKCTKLFLGRFFMRVIKIFFSFSPHSCAWTRRVWPSLACWQSVTHSNLDYFLCRLAALLLIRAYVKMKMMKTVWTTEQRKRRRALVWCSTFNTRKLSVARCLWRKSEWSWEILRPFFAAFL